MTTNPKIVQKIQEAISSKLGRKAIVRKVKNQADYFIVDLAFSYFQKADRNRAIGYRSGYQFFKNEYNENCLNFLVTHSPIMFEFLRNNLDYSRFIQLVIDTSKYRDEHLLVYKIKGYKKSKRISEENLDDFLMLIDAIEKNKNGFAKSVFSKSNNNHTGLGNIFIFRIARDFKASDVDEIIDLTWPLFMWLYPTKPLFNRVSSLNRSLGKLEKQCEIKAIRNLPESILTTPCNEPIEGAHIKTHKLGGSDKLENGLWLCKKHHKMTEGKIAGQRSLAKIEVTYKT